MLMTGMSERTASPRSLRDSKHAIILTSLLEGYRIVEVTMVVNATLGPIVLPRF